MAKIRRRSWKTPAGESREAWIADYKDQSGTRRLKTFTTRREADAWLVGARSEVAAGTHTAASASITVAEACARWIAHGEAEGLAAPAVAAYQASYRAAHRRHQTGDAHIAGREQLPREVARRRQVERDAA